MIIRKKAIWIEQSTSSGREVEYSMLHPILQIYADGAGFIRWEISELESRLVPGSLEKWYLHPKNNPYPRLLVQEAVPGLKATNNSGRGSGVVLPGFALLGLLLLGLAVLVLLFTHGLPLIADEGARRFPAEWEQELGNSIRNQTLSSMKVDSGRTRLLQELVRNIDFRTGEGAFAGNPELVVVQNPEFNAFAMPGGTIIVHTGALEKINSFPALMALIGHENGHVRGRHSLRTLARSLGLYAVASLVFGDFTGLAAVVADNAQNLQSLSYSRDFEREADQAGFDFLCLNKIPAQGMVDLMRIMEKEGGDASLPGLLSTHPLTEERLESAEARRKKMQSCANSALQPETDSLFMKLKKI